MPGLAGLVIEADEAAPPASDYVPDITDEEIAALARFTPPLPDLAHTAAVAYGLPPMLTTTNLMVDVLAPNAIPSSPV
jgi:hypothetical protein